MQIRLIVGLGNPGREYRDTRHNIGFMVLDRLTQNAGVRFQKETAWTADVAKASGVFLCKPLSFMNLSGEVVRTIGDFYKISPPEILVVCDDMALPLGKIRLRTEGSAGGHNGLRSIIDHLGTKEFPRLRVGIGAAEPGGATGHVLGRFADSETAPLKESLDRALAAVECAQQDGIAEAMNKFN